jgi:hypothetical protein
MCPHCGRDAPIVYRGVVPYCTACGGVRAPLSGASVNLAGKPSRVGGAVASVVGWVVLLFGLSAALGVGLLLGAIFTMGVALAVALPLAIIVLGVGIALVGGGGALRRSGTDAERTAREQALLAMAAHQGAITAADAASALGVSIAEADDVLTGLAKRDPDRIAVDVDDQGGVWYRFAASAGVPAGPWRPGPRVEEGGPRVRVPGGDGTTEIEDAVEADETKGDRQVRR